MRKANRPPAPRRGLVIGCGGTLGFAWTAATLQAVEHELGWNARTADVLVGTSAGSEAVALLGTGRSAESVVEALSGSNTDPVLARHLSQHPGTVPPVPRPSWPATGLVLAGLRGDIDRTAALAGLLPRGRGDATWLDEFGHALAGGDNWATHPATWIVAADTKTGERVAFGSPGAPQVTLGRAITASWAIPGWFPPVRIQGREYVDGGTVSTASADLVLPLELDEVIVLAPMASAGPAPAAGAARVERVLRRRMSRGLDTELAALSAAGTRVVRVHPSQQDLDAMGANFMDLSRRDHVLATAIRTAPSTVRAALTEGVPA